VLIPLPETVYIDEVQGSDETGQGTQEAPFKTAVKALDFAGEEAKIQVKKDEEEYKEISASALKKAKKTLVEQQRKAKKQEEQRLKQEQDKQKKAEGDAKALEAAKSIVLSEDQSLPKASPVCANSPN
jgi:asparaginyl-tRNA synthetase